jgi:hypothetical protein
MLLTNRGFGPDWTNHLWMIWVQAQNLHDGGPSLFVHVVPTGIFYPLFLYYGGTLYTEGAALSVLLGDRPNLAYEVMWAHAFVMAYAGLFWFGHQAGLRGWRLHAAPLVYVTSAYFLTDVYARGTFAEVNATSGLVLLLAAGLAILRAERLGLAVVAAFAWATVQFTGSHNVTLVWGTVLTCALVVVLGVSAPHLLRRPRRWAVVLGVGILASGVNAWFLLPDIMYAGRALMSVTHDTGGDFAWWATGLIGGLPNMLRPLRHVPSGSSTPLLYLQLPVLVMAWVVAGAVLMARRARRLPGWTRAVVGLAVISVALLFLLGAVWPWKHLPVVLIRIQFAMRLQSYLMICIALLVVAVLLALRGAPARVERLLAGSLAAALGVGVVFAVWQVWQDDPSWPSREVAFQSRTHVPPNWVDRGFYRDGSHRVVDISTGRWLVIPPGKVAGDRLHTRLALPHGPAPTVINVPATDYLLDIEGVHLVGRTANGQAAVTRPADRPVGRVMVTIRPAEGTGITWGRRVTYASVAGLALALLAAAWTLRRRDGGPAQSAADGVSERVTV